MLWRCGEWRQPSPNERATIMGLPTTAVQEILSDEPDKRKRTAKINGAIGNSFHIPSMMLVLVFLFQLGDRVMSTPVPRPWEDQEEQSLRRRIRDTVFDDVYIGKSLFLTTPLDIAKDTLRLLPGIVWWVPLTEDFAVTLAW